MRLMKITLEDGSKVSGWKKAVNVSDASIREYTDANLRELFDDEIILDVESRFHAKHVREQLLKEGWGFEEWNTQSRGRHFQIRVKGLENLDEARRLLYRGIIIDYFKADPSKKNGFIAMEHKPHLKSGKPKVLVMKVDKVNKISLKVLREANLLLNQSVSESEVFVGGNELRDRLKRKIKPSDLWRSWGLKRKGARWDTPFGVSKSKACVSINDKERVWYDFHTQQGGDVFTAVMLKHSCSFPEAVERLKDGRY